MKVKFRILQCQKDYFVVQGKAGWCCPWFDSSGAIRSLEAAETRLFEEMQAEEERQFVPRVVGDPVEYELRYLKQRIADISKL